MRYSFLQRLLLLVFMFTSVTALTAELTPWAGSPTYAIPSTQPSAGWNPPVTPSAPVAVSNPWGGSGETKTAKASSQQGKPIILAVSGNMYASIHQGKPSGVIAEAAASILKMMGYAPRVVTMSSSEMKDGLKSGEVGIAAGLLVGKAPKDGIAYSDSIIREYNVLLARKGEGRELQTLTELKGMKLGARVGFKYPYLERIEEIKLVRQRKDGENIRDLFLNDLDMVVVGSISDIYEFRGEGVMSSLELLDKAVGFVDLGCAFSQAKLGNDFESRFNIHLKEFIGSESWNSILEHNGVLDLVKSWMVVEK